MAHRLDPGHDWSAPLTGLGQHQPDHHRHQQNLKDVALRKGVDDRVRNNVEKEVADRLLLGLTDVCGDSLGVECLETNIHAGTGASDIGHHQTYCERQGRENLEVENRLGSDAPHLAHVLHPGDP